MHYDAPANLKGREKFRELAEEMFRENLRKGVFGRISIQCDLNDGTIINMRKTAEQQHQNK